MLGIVRFCFLLWKALHQERVRVVRILQEILPNCRSGHIFFSFFGYCRDPKMTFFGVLLALRWVDPVLFCFVLFCFLFLHGLPFCCFFVIKIFLFRWRFVFVDFSPL
jgi:hypothetical protein